MKKIIIILLIIFILSGTVTFIIYKTKQNKVSILAKELLSQIEYIKGREDDVRLIETLKNVRLFKVFSGNKPRLYKAQDKIIAVLNDGTELGIILYTGDWSFSIETIDGWYFRTENWLKPINL